MFKVIILFLLVTIYREPIIEGQSLTFGEPDNVIRDIRDNDDKSDKNEKENGFERWKRDHQCSWESGRQDMDSSISSKLHPSSLIDLILFLFVSNISFVNSMFI